MENDPGKTVRFIVQFRIRPYFIHTKKPLLRKESAEAFLSVEGAP